MKKKELMPTEKNLINTLINDTIGRNKDIVDFLNILKCQEASCSIALNGKWGSGKTFFVRQTEMFINASSCLSQTDKEVKDKITSSVPIKEFPNDEFAIYYDAWENDNDTDPIFSLIYEITNQINADFSTKEFSLSNVCDLAASIISIITRHDVNKILESLKSENKFEDFKKEKSTKKMMSEFFTEILCERGNRLVIFIDELDRCKPTYAIKLLEQIKHYMMDDRITFVFSVNLEQLQHTIKCYYGADFDASRYLDRFFDFRIDLPAPDMDKFFEELSLEKNYNSKIILNQIVKMFDFKLREISRLWSQVYVANHNVYDKTEFSFIFPDDEGMEIILIYIVPLMIGLRIADIPRYEDFINGKDSTPLKELLEEDTLKSLLTNMLDNNESFIEEDGKKQVTHEMIIERFYGAVFGNQYTKNIFEIELGKYMFSRKSKEFAIRASSMMSEYAELS